MGFDTPVAFFIFNRPDQTRRTFARIAQLRPSTLLVVADAPRNADEQQRCDDTRAILTRIVWDCDIRVNFAERNMGCRHRVASGLDWVFTLVEEAIILEDDCLPDPTFFPFCRELLARYRDEPRISMIAGDNFQFGRRRTPFSYYFSIIPHIWGWATWRRSWRYFDLAMTAWPRLRDTRWLEDLLGHDSLAQFYRDMFDRAYRAEVDTWDIQWVFACFAHGGYTILPEVNLVSNIGFGSDATHTRNRHAPESQIPTAPMVFPLRHPPSIVRQTDADEFTFANTFRQPIRPNKAVAA
jgi:hypothetical protein